MTKKSYILVLNWNNWADTVECLDSLYRSRYGNLQVVFIDNLSDDGSEEKVLAWARGDLKAESKFSSHGARDKQIPTIRYNRAEAEAGGDPDAEASLAASLPEGVSHPLVVVQTGDDLGYAGGNNVGLRYALGRGDAEYAWVLNNDTAVHPDALTELIKCIEAEPGAAMAGSKLLYYDSPGTLQAAGGCMLNPALGNTSLIGGGEPDGGRWDSADIRPDYINGASMLVRLSALARIGLLNERYFLNWEDAEWGLIARREGFKLLYCPKSRVMHKEGGTVGRVSPTIDYYWVRNGLFFSRAHYPAFLPLTMAAYFFKYTIIRLIRRQPLNFGAFAAGVWDFLRGKDGFAR